MRGIPAQRPLPQYLRRIPIKPLLDSAWQTRPTGRPLPAAIPGRVGVAARVDDRGQQPGDRDDACVGPYPDCAEGQLPARQGHHGSRSQEEVISINIGSPKDDSINNGAASVDLAVLLFRVLLVTLGNLVVCG